MQNVHQNDMQEYGVYKVSGVAHGDNGCMEGQGLSIISISGWRATEFLMEFGAFIWFE